MAGNGPTARLINRAIDPPSRLPGPPAFILDRVIAPRPGMVRGADQHLDICRTRFYGWVDLRLLVDDDAALADAAARSFGCVGMRTVEALD
jgi:hypothetical protein